MLAVPVAEVAVGVVALPVCGDVLDCAGAGMLVCAAAGVAAGADCGGVLPVTGAAVWLGVPWDSGVGAVAAGEVAGGPVGLDVSGCGADV